MLGEVRAVQRHVEQHEPVAGAVADLCLHHVGAGRCWDDYSRQRAHARGDQLPHCGPPSVGWLTSRAYLLRSSAALNVVACAELDETWTAGEVPDHVTPPVLPYWPIDQPE